MSLLDYFVTLCFPATRYGLRVFPPLVPHHRLDLRVIMPRKIWARS
jgi:hypothetical protein